MCKIALVILNMDVVVGEKDLDVFRIFVCACSFVCVCVCAGLGCVHMLACNCVHRYLSMTVCVYECVFVSVSGRRWSETSLSLIATTHASVCMHERFFVCVYVY